MSIQRAVQIHGIIRPIAAGIGAQMIIVCNVDKSPRAPEEPMSKATKLTD